MPISTDRGDANAQGESQTPISALGDSSRPLSELSPEEIGSQLFKAAASGDLALLDALLDFGSNPNQASPGGPPALFFAIEEGHLECASRLLPLTDPLARDAAGNSILCAAAARDNENLPSSKDSVFVALALPFCNPTDQWPDCVWPLALAAEKGHVENVRLLIPRSNPLSFQAMGRTPLMIAALNGQAETVRLLLPFSDPLARSDPKGPFAANGRTALEFAVGGNAQHVPQGRLDCVKLLTPASDLRAKNGWGQTVLGIAIFERNLRAAELLAPFFDVSKPDTSGDSHFIQAAKLMWWPGVEALSAWASEADLRAALDFSEGFGEPQCPVPVTRSRVEALDLAAVAKNAQFAAEKKPDGLNEMGKGLAAGGIEAASGAENASRRGPSRRL